MGKHDRENDEDGQVPPDKPIPKDNWRDDGGRHSADKQEDDKQEDDKRDDDEK